MRAVYLHVLCEGQTELRFAGKVLSPFFAEKDIIVLPQLLVTNRRKNAKGGMLSYQQSRRDLSNMIKGAQDNERGVHFFTTMFDLYSLPDSFPGYEKAGKLTDYARVQSLEQAFEQDVDCYKFIPYIQLHEFEALVLCDTDGLALAYPNAKSELEALKNTVVELYDNNPELVDDGVETAPSKRIEKALAGKYHYDKPKSGTEITDRIGIEALRTKCHHFDEWITKIENAAQEQKNKR